MHPSNCVCCRCCDKRKSDRTSLRWLFLGIVVFLVVTIQLLAVFGDRLPMWDPAPDEGSVHIEGSK